MKQVRGREPGVGESARPGTDVFISYAREDRRFVGRLHDALAAAGQEAWVDWEGIPASAKWMAEVRAAIDAAEAFCFVISPDSVESPVCREEAAHAAASNKRIVPLLHREVAEGLVPETVAAHNWIDFISDDRFDEAFDVLAEAIASDPEWTRAHTRLLLRAKEWDQAGRDRARLLRGSDLTDAEGWLAAAEGKDPGPSALQGAYVGASRRAASRRHRAGIAAVAGVLVLSLVLSSVALVQRNTAVEARADAERNATESKSRELAAVSGRALEDDPELGLLLAVESAEAAETDQARIALVETLRDSLLRASYSGVLPEGMTATVNADGTRVLGFNYLRAGLWDAATMKVIATFDASQGGAAFSADGDRVVILGKDHRTHLFDAADGSRLPVTPTPVAWHPRPLVAPYWGFAQLDPTGTRALTQTRSYEWILWDTTSGERVTAPELDEFNGGAFSDDGLIVGVHQDPAELTLASAVDGRTVERIRLDGSPTSAAFSADGSTIFTDGLRGGEWKVARDHAPRVVQVDGEPVPGADGIVLSRLQEGGVRVWDELGTQLTRITGLRDVNDAAVSDDTRLIATASGEQTIQVFDVGTGNPVTTLRGHTDQISHVEFLPDGRLLSSGTQGIAMLWDLNAAVSAEEIHVSSPHRLDVVAATPGGIRAVVPAGASVNLVDPATGDVLSRFRAGGEVADASLSSDGSVVAAGSLEGGATVWDTETGSVLLRVPSPVTDVAVSPDGSRLVTTEPDGASSVWDPVLGTQVATIGRVSDVSSPAFLPTGAGLLVWRRAQAGQDVARLQVLDASTGRELVDVGDVPENEIVWASPAGNAIIASLADDESGSASVTLVPIDGGERIRLTPNDDLDPDSSVDILQTFAFAEDGDLIAGSLGFPSQGEEAWAIGLWRSGGSQVPLELVGHSTYPTATAFSPDGQVLASSSGDQTVRLWDVATGQPASVLGAFESPVLDVGFSPDAEQLVTAERHGRLAVWDIETGSLLMAMVLPDLRSASFIDRGVMVAITKDLVLDDGRFVEEADGVALWV